MKKYSISPVFTRCIYGRDKAGGSMSFLYSGLSKTGRKYLFALFFNPKRLSVLPDVAAAKITLRCLGDGDDPSGIRACPIPYEYLHAQEDPFAYIEGCGLFSNTVTVTAPGLYSWDVTEIVKQWNRGNQRYKGLLFFSENEEPDPLKKFEICAAGGDPLEITLEATPAALSMSISAPVCEEGASTPPPAAEPPALPPLPSLLSDEPVLELELDIEIGKGADDTGFLAPLCETQGDYIDVSCFDQISQIPEEPSCDEAAREEPEEEPQEIPPLA